MDFLHRSQYFLLSHQVQQQFPPAHSFLYPPANILTPCLVLARNQIQLMQAAMKVQPCRSQDQCSAHLIRQSHLILTQKADIRLSWKLYFVQIAVSKVTWLIVIWVGLLILQVCPSSSSDEQVRQLLGRAKVSNCQSSVHKIWCVDCRKGSWLVQTTECSWFGWNQWSVEWLAKW